jgi:hypothetical protein
MEIDLTALPVDVDSLHQLVRELATQVADDDGKLATAQAEVERLRLIIQRFQRTQFGRRSERLDDDQLALGFRRPRHRSRPGGGTPPSTGSGGEAGAPTTHNPRSFAA